MSVLHAPAACPRPASPAVGALRRVGQFARALRLRPDARIDGRLRHLLADERQWLLLARLSAFDRAHHLRVHHTLVAWGQTDPELLRAALLHDAGKADDCGRASVPHRVALVLLRASVPGLLSRLAAQPGRGPWRGMYLAVHHAALGAQHASLAGASVRCCELIAGHAGPAGEDTALAALIAADA